MFWTPERSGPEMVTWPRASVRPEKPVSLARTLSVTKALETGPLLSTTVTLTAPRMSPPHQPPASVVGL